MSFDQLAPHYDWLERVLAGERLQRCRTAFLSRVRDGREVLICGEGHGRFLLACRRALPDARITCVDSSAGMFDRARRRLASAGLDPASVEWVCSDLLDWTPPVARFDLVVTQFFLDCFSPDQLADVVTRIGLATRPGSRWLLADFCVPTSGLARVRARAIHALMYGFFRFVTGLRARAVTPPESLLIAQGFGLTERRHSEWGLLHTDLWTRLRQQ